MPHTATRRAAVGWRVLLVGAVLLEMHTLYFTPSPAVRVSFGVFLLAIIILASSRIELVAYLEAHLPAKRPIRRFNRLRAQVVQFIGEIQRMNWLAVDLRRGVVDKESQLKEIDAIEDRLNFLVKRIRQEAGQ